VGGSRFPERPRRAAQTYVSLLRTALADIGWVSIGGGRAAMSSSSTSGS